MNEQRQDDDEPITLNDACKVIFKNVIGPDTLRAEAQRGRLVIERIGRRDFVTRKAIREMRKKCELDPSPKGQGSGSNRNEQTPTEVSNAPAGSSGTDPLKVARDAALMTVAALKKPLPSTSRKNTGRPKGTVIPLKPKQPTS